MGKQMQVKGLYLMAIKDGNDPKTLLGKKDKRIAGAMAVNDQPDTETEITDNLTLLAKELLENSFARQLVDAYRDSGDPDSALKELADKRLEELRVAYAAPAHQDD